MIVCVCRRVSDRDIHRAAQRGVAAFDELQSELGIATGCGACLDCARETWREACATAAAPAARRVVALQPLPAAAVA